eukprot:7225383-Prymnesium_polylepis.1
MIHARGALSSPRCCRGGFGGDAGANEYDDGHDDAHRSGCCQPAQRAGGDQVGVALLRGDRPQVGDRPVRRWRRHAARGAGRARAEGRRLRLPHRARPQCVQRLLAPRHAGEDVRAVRPVGCGQEHDHPAPRALLRSALGRGAARWGGHQDAQRQVAALAAGAGWAGAGAVHGQRGGQHRVRQAWSEPGGDRGGSEDGERAHVYRREPPGGLPDTRRPGRRQAFRWSEAARGDRSGADQGAVGASVGRGDVGAGQREREGGAGGAGRDHGEAEAHHNCDRSPAVDHPARGRDCGRQSGMRR